MKPQAFFVLVAAFVVGGCTNPNSSPPQPGNTAPAPASTSKPEQPVRGYLRALHAVPGAGTLSLTASGEKFASVKYGDATSFEGIHAQNVEVSAFGSDGKKVAGPMSLSLGQGEDVTVLVTGVPGDTVLLPWKHKNGGPAKDEAKIAFVHSAKSLPAVEIKLDGNSFRRDVKFGIATDYTTLKAGSHEVAVTYKKELAPLAMEIEPPTVVTKDANGHVMSIEQPTPVRTSIPRTQEVTLAETVTLDAGKVYSLAIFHDGAQEPKVRLMEDKFVPDVVRAESAG